MNERSKARKTLVTGAGGFIGSHLSERLVKDGHTVRALVHYNARNDWGALELLDKDVLREIEVVAGDVQDPFLVDRAVSDREVVFHLASLIAIPYSYMAPQSYVATNVAGAVNVMQACLRHGVGRVVHTSTSECYGSARFVPMTEDHPLQGQSPYSASKIGADMVAFSYWCSYQLPVATIRPFNTYGPRQSARAVIPTMIVQSLTQGRLKLGALAPIRDLTYVDDTVEGFVRIAAADQAVGTVINVGSGQGISIGDLATLVAEIAGARGGIEHDAERLRPERSEVDRLVCDNGKAKSVLGWAPTVRLRDGVERTMAWIRDNLDRYKAELFNL